MAWLLYLSEIYGKKENLYLYATRRCKHVDIETYYTYIYMICRTWNISKRYVGCCYKKLKKFDWHVLWQVKQTSKEQRPRSLGCALRTSITLSSDLQSLGKKWEVENNHNLIVSLQNDDPKSSSSLLKRLCLKKGAGEWQIDLKLGILGVARSPKKLIFAQSPHHQAKWSTLFQSISYVLKKSYDYCLTKASQLNHLESTSKFLLSSDKPFQSLVQLRSGNCKENNTKAIEHVTGVSTLTSQTST